MLTPNIITELLRETDNEHVKAERRLPEHEWQIWFGAYMHARLAYGKVESTIAADAVTWHWLANAKETLRAQPQLCVVCGLHRDANVHLEQYHYANYHKYKE
jgi:hypothetical protein